MPPDPIRMSGAGVDLGPRLYRSGTVDASPAAAAETIVCTVTIPEGVTVTKGVFLSAYVALTIGASGVSLRVRIRQTNASGTTVKDSGLTTVTAANLVDRAMVAFDASPGSAGQVYVLTLTVGSGAAASTVSAVELQALVV